MNRIAMITREIKRLESALDANPADTATQAALAMLRAALPTPKPKPIPAPKPAPKPKPTPAEKPAPTPKPPRQRKGLIPFEVMAGIILGSAWLATQPPKPKRVRP